MSCPTCNNPISPGAKQCIPCRKAATAQHREQRIARLAEQLRQHALETGVVPSNLDAAWLLKAPVNITSAACREAFGPDPRKGGERRKPRRYPHDVETSP